MTDSDQAKALVRRYLDPSTRWSVRDDERLRALCRASEAAAALYNKAVIRHRRMLGGDPQMPSGFELSRLARVSAERAAPPRPARRWLAWLVPVVAAAAALFIATRPASPSEAEYIGARGMAGDLPERRVGLGVGAVTEAGDEHEAIFAPAHIEDWLRFAYTNERPDLGWLFIVGLQPERAVADRIVWLAPTPEEGRSLPLALARHRQLPFEIRLASRHEVGPVRFLAFFTAQPLDSERVASALASIDPSAVSSVLETDLRRRLELSQSDVVQVLETRIVSGSAADELPAPPGKEANPP